MGNCLVAQSGGPTAVINASLAGVIRANQLNPVYGRVLGGIHGIEGVLAGRLFDLTDLPAREIEVLVQIARGLSNKQIAERLRIGATTVISHRRNLTEKLGIRSVAGLTLHALTMGYVDPDAL